MKRELTNQELLDRYIHSVKMGLPTDKVEDIAAEIRSNLQSLVEDGHLRAYSTKDGSVLGDFDTAREFPTVSGKPAHGGSIDATGAAVAGGMVFVSSGYNQYGSIPGNVLLARSPELAGRRRLNCSWVREESL